jgi:hypothetical protein
MRKFQRKQPVDKDKVLSKAHIWQLGSQVKNNTLSKYQVEVLLTWHKNQELQKQYQRIGPLRSKSPPIKTIEQEEARDSNV